MIEATSSDLTPRERWDLDVHDRSEEVEVDDDNDNDYNPEVESLIDVDLEDDLDTTVTVDAVTATASAIAADLSDLNDMSDLDALLEVSMQESAASRRVKALRQKIAVHKATPDDLKALAEAEFIASWHPVANALVFNRYQCPECGARLTVFDCLMEEQENKWNKTSHRWLRREVQSPALPTKTIIREHNLNACGDCFAEQERGTFEVKLSEPALVWSGE